MATTRKYLFDSYDGKGIAAQYSKYSERANKDVDGNPIKTTYVTKGELPGTMTGASQQAAGSSGLVPAPAAGDQDKVLRGDGTWGDAANATVSYNSETGELHLDFSPQVNAGGN